MRDTLNTNPWLLTDNSNGPVMVIRNYRPALIQTEERKQFLLFDLDLWPTTLTYNPRLA